MKPTPWVALGVPKDPIVGRQPSELNFAVQYTTDAGQVLQSTLTILNASTAASTMLAVPVSFAVKRNCMLLVDATPAAVSCACEIELVRQVSPPLVVCDASVMNGPAAPLLLAANTSLSLPSATVRFRKYAYEIVASPEPDRSSVPDVSCTDPPSTSVLPSWFCVRTVSYTHL